MSTDGKWSGKGFLDISQHWDALDARTDKKDLSPEETKAFGDPLLLMAAHVINGMQDEHSHPTYLRAVGRVKDGRLLTVAVDLKPEGAVRQDTLHAAAPDLLAALKGLLRWDENEAYETPPAELWNKARDAVKKAGG